MTTTAPDIDPRVFTSRAYADDPQDRFAIRYCSQFDV